MPSGESIETVIEMVDAATQAAPAYYMVNCAHPTHFQNELKAGKPWVARLRGIRANVSRKSHAELDEAQDLDAGDPHELAAQHCALADSVPSLNVLDGRCATDHRHIEEMCNAILR